MSSRLQAARLLLGGIVVSAILLPRIWEPVVTGFYQSLRNWYLFQCSFFETIETLFVYGLIEPIYTAVYARHPANRIDIRARSTHLYTDKRQLTKKNQPPLPKMKRPWHRFRELFTFMSPLLLLDLTMIKKYANVDVAAIRESGGYGSVSVGNSSTSSSGTPDNISPYFLLPTLHNFTLQSPLQTARALPVEAPSSRRLALELIVSLFLYDALFFSIHLAFHRIPLLARIHAPHHTHSEMHPQVTNRLSVGERLALILLANFALNIIGSHVLTRTLFVPMFVYMLIEVHSGVDLPWQYDKFLPEGWGAGARKHAAHHKEGRRHFAPFFSWWDDALEAWEKDTSNESTKLK